MSEYKINRDSIKHLLETPPCVGVSVNVLPIQTMVDEINQKAEMRIMQTISVYCDPDVLKNTIHKNQELMKELAELYKKIEDGTLVEMPCKVGDVVYMPWRYAGTKGIAILTVKHIIISTNHSYIRTDFSSDDDGFWERYNGGEFDFSDFGKTVFLTREEAEKALERGNDEISNDMS